MGRTRHTDEGQELIEVVLSLLPVLLIAAMTVAPLALFLLVLRWRSNRHANASASGIQLDRQAVWQRAIVSRLYGSAVLILSGAAFLWFWSAVDNSRTMVLVLAALHLGGAVFSVLRVARQLDLGWDKAQHTAWARSIVDRHKLPTKKSNQSPIEFGENGAVLK
jgi:hypothetical protein